MRKNKKVKTLFFCWISLPFFGQWNPNPTFNTGIIIQPKSQQNIHCVSDTKKGTIITWDDNRNILTTSTDIYAQRIKSNGFAKWVTNGIPICTEIGIQKSNNITSGGVDGSSIITWEDGRSGNYDIYAQKIDSSGNVLWGTNGLLVCNRPTNQKNPKIVSDNVGGAIIVWEDSASFYFDIYAQRISSTGAAQWLTNGVSICNAPNQQQNPTLDIDGWGGAIITWQDKRLNVDYDIYAQKINSIGIVGWTANGIVVCNAVNTQSNPKIEPDGTNGAIIGWIDKRNALNYDIYSQRINSSGATQWTINGTLVCGAANNQSALDMKYLGTSGVVYSWKDDRISNTQIYAQILDLTGVIKLPIDGIQLSSGLKSINPNSIKDGVGGAIIAWQDSTSVGWDIKSQKINSLGVIQWPFGGSTVSNAIDDQISVTQVTDNTGGAIYIWEDKRNGTNIEIYAHHLYFTGTEVVGINENSKSNLEIICYPNPICENSIIKIKNNDTSQPYEINIYDAFGNLLVNKTFNANTNFELSNIEYKSGIYFYYIEAQDKSINFLGNFISTK